MILPMSWPVNTNIKNSRPVKDPTDKLVTRLAAVSLRDRPGTSMGSHRVSLVNKIILCRNFFCLLLWNNSVFIRGKQERRQVDKEWWKTGRDGKWI